MARILVTDAEQRASLAVVRSLGRAGHHVVVCAARRHPLAGASRFCRSSHVVPDPRTDPGGYLAGIERVVDSERIEIVVPLTDRSAPTVPALRRGRPGVAVAFPPYEAYERISDKKHLMEVAGELGVPVPRQTVLETSGERATADGIRQAGLDFPVVLKPARSAVTGETGVHSFGIRFVASERDLDSALADYPPEAYPLLVQQRISGPGIGAFVLADRGRIIASFGHRRLREKPPTGGVSVYRESIPIREDVLRYTERILARFAWTGVAMVEFKEDTATGTPYLMEVNGRFWGSLQLAIDAGVDFPDLLVRTVLGEKVAPVSSYRVGVRSRWLWGDVDHLLWMLKAPRSVLASHPELPSRARALARFVVPWRPGDRFEVLRLGDPGPFVRESVQWVQSVLGLETSTTPPLVEA